MSALSDRILKKSLLSKVCKAQDTVRFFKNGMSVAWSGFTPSGYPKLVPPAVADWVEKNKLQDGKFRIDLFTGASSGAECDDRWAALGITKRRFPYQTGKNIQKRINQNYIEFADMHLSRFPMNMRYGFYTKEQKGKLDIAVIEGTEILEDGSVVLGGASGIAGEACAIADKVIVEINTSIPSYRGVHDVVVAQCPPYKRPFLISRVDDRIGTEGLPIDPEKIVAIVESKNPDKGRALAEPDTTSKKIAENIMQFFDLEVKSGRLPKNLLPIQSGVGNIANAVVAGLAKGKFENLVCWTEVLQDSFLEFFDSGKLLFASAASLSLSTPGFKKFYADWENYKRKIILRPQYISNNPELVRRLGVIGMNTPVEIDIFGHANSTHVGGTKMVNGLGGSGDFLRNAYISIMHTPSARKTKTDKTGISCIVPMCTHVDHTEHDLDVFATEQGLADMRGLSPVKRAREVINKCAHPDYKDQLHAYLDLAIKKNKDAAHEPQMLNAVFKMHQNLKEKGSMKVDKW